MKNVDHYDWGVCIFSSREDCVTLKFTLMACVIACSGKRSIIDILINGNNELAKNILQELNAPEFLNNNLLTIRIWTIDEPDKANGFNQYFHKIWPNSNVVFFVDGYVQPWADAFINIENELMSSNKALAATGVPTSGRSADFLRREMISSGGIHGNLFALKKSTIIRIREINFNLPLGVYRTDPIIGAALAFNLEPKNNDWDIKSRVLVVSKASWNLPQKSKSIINEAVSFFKRKIRQERGELENIAIKEQFTVFKKSPGDLPVNAEVLISGWVNSNKKDSLFLFLKHPLALYAYKYTIQMFPGMNLEAKLVKCFN